MLAGIKDRIALYNKRRAWRKANLHNESVMMNDFDPKCVTVGRKTYGGISVYNYNNNSHLTIGSFCSIASNVMFILNADHHIDTLSTYPFRARYFGEQEGVTKGDIIVDDDVWIGYGVTVMSGVHIGQGAIIAAGAVVTKDVPPYSIVGGIPAGIIKFRFNQDLIDTLMKFDYSKLTDAMIKQNIEDLYKSIDGLNQEEINKLFSWYPKR